MLETNRSQGDSDPQVIYIVPCREEEDKYPKKALRGNSLDALAAFSDVRHLVRRCEGCRDLLRRGKDLPEGFYAWRCMPPDIEDARKRVNECRAALTVGFRHGLQSKDHRVIDWTLYHDRAIDDITPLANALRGFKEKNWLKMGLDQRIIFANKALKGMDKYMEHDLGLAYAEAAGAAELLRLPKDDHYTVIDGAYACYRLDWLVSEGTRNTSDEMRRHVKTIVKVANNLTEYALAEKIDAVTKTRPKIIDFVGSALFDRFKGHLVDVTKHKLQQLKTPPPETPKAMSTDKLKSTNNVVHPESLLHETAKKMADLIRSKPGKTGKEIARELALSEEHVRRLFKKKLKPLGFTNPGGGAGYHSPPNSNS